MNKLMAEFNKLRTEEERIAWYLSLTPDQQEEVRQFIIDFVTKLWDDMKPIVEMIVKEWQEFFQENQYIFDLFDIEEQEK